MQFHNNYSVGRMISRLVSDVDVLLTSPPGRSQAWRCLLYPHRHLGGNGGNELDVGVGLLCDCAADGLALGLLAQTGA